VLSTASLSATVNEPLPSTYPSNGENPCISAPAASTIAVDSTGKNYPIVAHSSGSTSSFEIQRVVLSDESTAAFTNGPRFPPRSKDLDKSTLFLVYASVDLDGGTGHRLRAYAWNGVSGVKPQLLANETQSPRTFAEGLLTYGCGGAILYATDPTDGSHALDLVLVQ